MQKRNQWVALTLCLMLLSGLTGCSQTEGPEAVTTQSVVTTLPEKSVSDVAEVQPEQSLPEMPVDIYEINYLFYDEKQTGKVQIQRYMVEEHEEYFHFIVGYTAAEELGIEGYLCTEDKSDVFLTPDSRAKEGENLLEFDLRKENIEEYREMDLFFVPETNENISLTVNLPMRIQLTNGTPTGNAVSLGYSLTKAWKSSDYQLHDCYVQWLDNDFIRYTIDLELPKRAYFSVFVIGNDGENLVLQLLTVNGRQQYVVDLPVEKLKQSKEVTVLIKEESSSYQNLILIPSSFVSACTDGMAVNDPIELEIASAKGNDSSRVNNCFVQLLDNGYYRYTLNYIAPEGVLCSVFDPPNAEKISHKFISCGGEQQVEFAFDVDAETAEGVDELTVLIGSTYSFVIKNNFDIS